MRSSQVLETPSWLWQCRVRNEVPGAGVCLLPPGDGILALLRHEQRIVNELAGTARLFDNAVRAQLAQRGTRWLVQQHGIPRGPRKPHVTYSLSGEAERVFSKASGLVVDYFVGILSRRLTPQALRTSMREVGRKLASAHLDRRKPCNRNERIKVAFDSLPAESGGEGEHKKNEK